MRADSPPVASCAPPLTFNLIVRDRADSLVSRARWDSSAGVFMLDFLEPGATFFVPAASVISGPSFQDGVGFVSVRMGILGFWPVAILEWEPTRHGPDHFSLGLYGNQGEAGRH